MLDIADYDNKFISFEFDSISLDDSTLVDLHIYKIKLDSLPFASNEKIDEDYIAFLEEIFRKLPQAVLSAFMKQGDHTLKFITAGNLETIAAARRANLTHINAYFVERPRTILEIMQDKMKAFDVFLQESS